MPLFAENEEKIFGDILYDVVEDTNITRSSPGSKMRAIAEAQAKKMGRMWSQFDTNMVQAYLQGADGRFLDFIGNMMGIERIGASNAAISATDRIVRFYVDVGSFGDINGGSSIVIPAGTLVGTQVSGTGIQYRIPFSVILPADRSEFYVSVESVGSGVRVNVGSNTLNFHNFNNYTDSVNDTLKITNESEIQTAQDLESNVNYRFRIANQVIAAEAGNLTSVRLAALQVANVADLIIIPFYKGIGTFDLIIQATTPSTPQSLVTAVGEAVAGVTSMGIIGSIRSPREIGVSLVATLTFRRIVTPAEESSIITAVTDNITDYINNLQIGEELVFNEIIERTLATSDLIKNIGTTGKPIDKMYIYKPSRLEDNRVREELLDDYQPEADEKLLIERNNAGNSPILIRTTNVQV